MSASPPRPGRPAQRSTAAGGRLALVPPPAPAHAATSSSTPVPSSAPLPEDPPALLRTVLGARLRRARQSQERSLRDVAAVAQVSIGHLSQVERGLAEASSEVLAALCRALGVPLHVLLRAAAVDLTGAPAPAARALTSLTAIAPARPSASRPGDGVRALAA